MKSTDKPRLQIRIKEEKSTRRAQTSTNADPGQNLTGTFLSKDTSLT